MFHGPVVHTWVAVRFWQSDYWVKSSLDLPCVQALEWPWALRCTASLRVMQRREVTSVTVVAYSVPGISCEGCANAIRRALSNVSGVLGVDVNVAGREVKVTFDEGRVAPPEIQAAIQDAGYDTEQVGA